MLIRGRKKVGTFKSLFSVENFFLTLHRFRGNELKISKTRGRTIQLRKKTQLFVKWTLLYSSDSYPVVSKARETDADSLAARSMMGWLKARKKVHFLINPFFITLSLRTFFKGLGTSQLIQRGFIDKCLSYFQRWLYCSNFLLHFLFLNILIFSDIVGDQSLRKDPR